MYSLERLVPIVCARILLIAIVFKNVDLPEALEPVRRTFPLVVIELHTGLSISGWNTSLTLKLLVLPTNSGLQ